MGLFFIVGIILVFICVAILILNRYRMPEIVKLISDYLVIPSFIIITVHTVSSKGGLVYFAVVHLHPLRNRPTHSLLNLIYAVGIGEIIIIHSIACRIRHGVQTFRTVAISCFASVAVSNRS